MRDPRDAMARLAAIAFHHCPPEYWAEVEEAVHIVSEAAAELERTARALEAALAREARMREALNLLEAALTNIQEEARRARGVCDKVYYPSSSPARKAQ